MEVKAEGSIVVQGNAASIRPCLKTTAKANYNSYPPNQNPKPPNQTGWKELRG